MRVINLELKNFRNLEDTRLDFSPSVNLITGRNSQGKTNLLEAIYLFSLGRSFRTARRSEMITFGEPHLYLKITTETDSGIRNRVEVGMERRGETRIRVNGEKVAGFSGVIGMFPGVLFTAEDVGLVSGSPSGRRGYLDYTASQISGEYLDNLREYYRTLRQRNAELKRTGQGEGGGLVRALAEVLAEKGEKVLSGRRKVLEDVTESAEKLLKDIFSGELEIGMEYISSVSGGGECYSESLFGCLERRSEEEVRKGYTVAGPHRDDIGITLDGLDMRKFGSQGRKRLVAIVMKIAQAEVINIRKGEKPAVLLDDIFSELDTAVEREVSDFISDKYQNFITTPRPVDLKIEADVRGFYVENGSIAGTG